MRLSLPDANSARVVAKNAPTWRISMNSVVSNSIIIAILAAVIILSIKGMIPHFKGEGACCGGGSGVKLVKPKKLDNVIAIKTIGIEGMVCDNCMARIHNALNSIDGVSAKVSRAKGQATVKLDRKIDEEKLRKAVTDLGYKVTEIE